MNDKETRVWGSFEIREADGDDGPRLVGHAAVFNKLSDDLGGFRERIDPEAFKRTLKEGADVRALVEHDPARILGRSTAGTLRLKGDDSGLLAEIDMPDTSAARDTMESVKRGDLTQMSFGFRTISDRWERNNDEDIRTLLDVDLFDVSVVAFPAYPDTDVAKRSLAVRSGIMTSAEAREREALIRRGLTMRRQKLDAHRFVVHS